MRTLQEAGPITLVLDECHHLLEVWGRLLGELLELLPDATVLGLTATPATTLTPDQAVLVDQLFGDVVYSASIPAVVREGHLAPFADLIWLTTPSATEAQWLADQNQRFAELTTQLLDPSFGSVPFLTWIDRRFAGDVRFDRIAAKQPLLADAALRMRYAGLLRLADDVPMGEQHRHAPTADDWALLIDDWYDACLVASVDDRDQDVREALRRSLPAVGYQLTKRGMRKGRSSVDRVLARSESKSRAMVEIISAEHRNLGDRLAMLVICDHEAAAATVGIDLKGVLAERAGSARLALASLLADPTTAALAPVMVTGKTVAAAPDVLERLRDRTDIDLVVGEPDSDGISELVGPSGAWTSREWVRAVTDFFTTGDTKVLIGTRALLGEGWDAPTASGLIDLSMASTAGTVVQTRGRTLRLDPRDEAKVAVNWTVCCVAEGHPKGDNDWQRTVDQAPRLLRRRPVGRHRRRRRPHPSGVLALRAATGRHLRRAQRRDAGACRAPCRDRRLLAGRTALRGRGPAVGLGAVGSRPGAGARRPAPGSRPARDGADRSRRTPPRTVPSSARGLRAAGPLRAGVHARGVADARLALAGGCGRRAGRGTGAQRPTHHARR